MSQVLHEKPGPPVGRTAETSGGRRPPRRLAAAVVALGLLLGAAAGWSATSLLGEDPVARSNAAWTARLEGAADRFEEQAETRRLDAERRRWESQADHFDPGWRER
jgi:hypothetical protein